MSGQQFPRRVYWTLLLVLPMILASSGCEMSGSNGRENSMRLIPSPTAFERDIPVPVGFEMEEESCEDQSTGTRRLYLRHIYTGNAKKYAVRKFYRDQMPRCKWAMVSDGNVKGVYTLRFEKGIESCEIEIADGDSLGRTRVQVMIVQEERGTTPVKSDDSQ